MNIMGYKIIFHKAEEFMEEPEVLGSFFNGYLTITQSLLTSWIVVLFIFLALYVLTRNLSVVPKSRKQIIVESAYSAINTLCTMLLGDKATNFIPFISTLFYYIFFCNISEFFPVPYASFSHGKIHIDTLFRAPTGDFNTTLALAIIASLGWSIATIRYRGFRGYLKEFVEPVFFMLPINLLEIIAKPFSLSMRLFGNIFAGSLVMSLIYKSVPIVVPIVMHLYFDIFVGIIQSCIFVVLTLVQISFAVKHVEHEAH